MTTTSGPPRVRLAYFVPPSEHFAGIERVVHEIATGLMEAHGDVLDVHVIYASGYDEELLADPAYHLHVLGVDRLRQLPGVLRRFVADMDFDVFVAPQVEASVMTWLATRGLGIPVFITHLHGNPQLEEADGSRRTRLAFQVFRRLVAPRIAAVLAVSPSLRDYAAQALVPRTPVHFAKNPVRDLGAGPRSPRGDRLRLVNVARLSHQKGQDLLLRALAAARPELPPVTLTLVGDGPEENALRALSSELGLDDIVVFAGYSSDPAGYLRDADAFVFASRWEGFGVVLVEALQYGLPLLATDCLFGPADVITDSGIGALVAAEDVEALAAGLRDLVGASASTVDDARRRDVARSYLRTEASETHFAILRSVVQPATGRSFRFAALDPVNTPG